MDVDTRPIMTFVQVVVVTSTVGTPSGTSLFLLKESRPRSGRRESCLRAPLGHLGSEAEAPSDTIQVGCARCSAS